MRTARRARFDGRPDLDPDRPVFLDETAATITMARRYGLVVTTVPKVPI